MPAKGRAGAAQLQRAREALLTTPLLRLLLLLLTLLLLPEEGLEEGLALPELALHCAGLERELAVPEPAPTLVREEKEEEEVALKTQKSCELCRAAARPALVSAPATELAACRVSCRLRVCPPVRAGSMVGERPVRSTGGSTATGTAPEAVAEAEAEALGSCSCRLCPASSRERLTPGESL